MKQSQIQPYKFRYAGNISNEYDIDGVCYYSDEYFKQIGEKYNPQLATMSLCLELASWSSYDTDVWTTDISAPEAKFMNVRNLLIGNEGIGFSDFAVNDAWSSEPTEDSVGAVIARKQLEDSTLIALVIRGCGYGKEWVSNFIVGEEGEHKGFAIAKLSILYFFNKYITEKKISGRIKLWMVGYSRAGAIANLIAGDIDDGYQIVDGITIDANDLYVYTFEAPRAAIRAEGKYDNIHNLINVNDLIPLIAPRSWGFERYSKDTLLPNILSPNYDKYFNRMQSFYYQLPNTTTVPYNILDYGEFVDYKITWKNNSQKEETKPLATKDIFLEVVRFLSENVIPDRKTYCNQFQSVIRDIILFIYDNEDNRGLVKKIFEKFNVRKFVNSLKIIIDASAPVQRKDYMPVLHQKIIDVAANISIEHNLEGRRRHLISNIAYISEKIIAAMLEECLNDNYKPLNYVVAMLKLVFEDKMNLVQSHYGEVSLVWLMSEDENYSLMHEN